MKECNFNTKNPNTYSALIEKLENNNLALQQAIEKIEKKMEEVNVKLDVQIQESPNWKVTSHRYDINSDNIDL